MTLNQFIGLVILLGGLAMLIWGYVWALKKAENPPVIVVKTIITLVVLIGFSLYARRLLSQGAAGLIAVPLAVVGGLIFMLLWRGHVTNAIAKPFEDLFTGGDAEPDPEPFYSIARTKRKMGHPAEAIALIDEQLEYFPGDFNGLMMKAEIQAIDQQNLSGAAETIDEICEYEIEHPRNVFTALCALADWHLQVYRNREAALACFERIRDAFPKHQVALDAAQRIAHLPSQTMLDDKLERRTITLKERPRVVVRERSDVKVEVNRESPDEMIARLEGQLELHPLDREAREELATLYAEHFGDLSSALQQLEFLFNQPLLDKQAKVRLLNRMTDLNVKFGDDLAAAEEPLQRIMDTYPGSPMAEQASRRKMMLRKEFQGKEKNQGIRLGSYEKDLGLRKSVD